MLAKYSSVFHEHEIDADAFVELSDQDLIEMGVKSLADRRKLLAEIKRLRHTLKMK